MSNIKIDSKSKIVLVKIKNSDRILDNELRHAWYFIGKQLKSTASKNILKKGRQGRKYRYKGRVHIASIAGESWANRSGTARKGLKFRVVNTKKLIFGNTVDYVKFLEEGTVKMKARPAHLISIKENRTKIINAFESRIPKAF